MFIGHYSAAFVAAAQPRAPRLATLFVAAQLVDLGFFTLVLTGGEAMRITPGFTVMNPMDLYHMPYTHSLIGSLVWAAGFGFVLRLLGASTRAALIGAGVVLSHWFIDLLVHGPDLTLYGQPPKFGIGLWNFPAIEMPLELGITAAAIWYFAHAAQISFTAPRMIAMVVFLLAVQLFNWFGPVPTEFDISMPISALLAYGVAIIMAWWLATGDKRRMNDG